MSSHSWWENWLKFIPRLVKSIVQHNLALKGGIRLTPFVGRRKAFIVGGLGIEMLLSPVIGLVGGDYLDQYFGTAPIIMISGLVLGVCAAIRIGAKIYRIGMKVMNEKPGAGNENE
jgi:hypothetical protein